MHIVKYDDSMSFIHAGHERGIERGEWRRETGDIYTAKVSTGIILAALNRDRGLGVIGNFCNLGEPSPRLSDRDEFDRCLSQIQAMGIYDTKVWAGGASHTFNQAGRNWVNVTDDRLFAEDQLKAHSLDYSIEWSPENTITYANLQSYTGRLVINQFELSNLQ